MLAAMDQEYQDALEKHKAAVNASIKAQNDLAKLIEESGSNKTRLRKASLHAIRSVKAAGVALLKLEKVKAKRSLQAAGESENAPQGQNDGTRTNGVYSFVEALGILLTYFICSTTYCVKHFQNYNNKYKGARRWDMVYFVVVTTLTIGYGDIYPATRGAKINTILLVLLGGILVSHLGDVVIETCKSWLKKKFFPTMIGRKKEAMVYLFSFMAAVSCIVTGMLGIFYTEQTENRDPEMTLFDAFYLSVMSLVTVGYGDFNFQLLRGRKFAVFWLLVCQPIFRESSKFVIAGCFRPLSSIIELHFKKLGSIIWPDYSVIIFLPFIVVPLLLMVFFI